MPNYAKRNQLLADPRFAPLLEEVERLGDLYYGNSGLSEVEFERELGRPLDAPQTDHERRNQAAHRNRNIETEIVRVFRKLIEARFPFSYINEVRGALSRNQVRAFLDRARPPVPARSTHEVDLQLRLSDVERLVKRLTESGDATGANRLAKAAQTFLRQFVEADDEETPPPGIPAEQRVEWLASAKADRALLLQRIQNLGTRATA